MLLTIDIGNSCINLGIFQNQELKIHWRIASDLYKTQDEYTVLMANLMSLNRMKVRDIKDAVMASVVPPLTRKFESSVRSLFHLEPLVMDHHTPIGIENRYDNPEEVGMDRLANAVGGKNLVGAPVIIIDFGTAITIDLVDKEGDYAGGVILPGREMSAEALFKRTAKLPSISLFRPPRVLGKYTIASMQSGLFYGTIGSIESLLKRLWKEIGYQTKVILTGGNASELVHEMSYLDQYDPHLTLRGLQVISHYNHKKNFR